MAAVAILAVLFASLATPVEAQAESARYVALPYVVRVAAPSVGMSEIRPRYLWLDDNRLIVPMAETVDQREWEDVLNISIFVLDVSAGTSVRVADYKEVFGLTLTASQQKGILFVSPIVDLVADETSPIGVRREYMDYLLDATTLDLTPTTLPAIQEQRASVQPGSPRPYPEALLRIDTNDLYESTQGSSANYFYWDRWNDYIVALGTRVGTDYTDPHDVRLYNSDGSTAFVFPEIRVFNEHVLGFPEVFQLSPDSRFLFLNENIATRSARDTLGLRDIRSVIYVYRFVDEDPRQQYDTVVYAADSEDFGVGYEIGEVFQLDRVVVDGSAFSGGPVAAVTGNNSADTSMASQSNEQASDVESAQLNTAMANNGRSSELEEPTERPPEGQRPQFDIIAGGIAVALMLLVAVSLIARGRRS